MLKSATEASAFQPTNRRKSSRSFTDVEIRWFTTSKDRGWASRSSGTSRGRTEGTCWSKVLPRKGANLRSPYRWLPLRKLETRSHENHSVGVPCLVL